MTKKNEDKNLFMLFMMWSYVLLCRPQDLMPMLSVVSPSLLLGVITLFIFIIKQQRSMSELNFENEQVKQYLFLFFLMLVSIPFSIYRNSSFLFMFKIYSQVVVFFLMFIYLIKNKERLNGFLALNVIGVIMYIGASLINGTMNDGRIGYGEMFDSNDLSFLVLSFMTFLLLFTDKKYSKMTARMAVIAWCVCFLFVLKTGSRAGLLGLVVVVILIFMTSNKLVAKETKKVIAGLLLILSTATAINYDRYSTLLDLGSDYNVTTEQGRLAIWKIGIKEMLSQPFTGVGVNCFPEAIGRDREQRGLAEARWQTAHNSLVQIGAEVGVLGFILFLTISYRAMRIFRKVSADADEDLRKISEAAMIGFSGHFICAMFLSQAYSVYWAFYIAMSVVIWRLGNPDVSVNKRICRLAIKS